MNRMQRTSPLVVLLFGVVGIGLGLLLQFARSTQGQATFVPPLSLTFTLVVLGAVLVVLGITLHRAVTRKSGKGVNPFHAVRLLAGARAGQFVGALLGGFAGGLGLQLLERSVPPPVATWLPIVLAFAGGIVLLICGYVTESLCRVPPQDPGEEQEGQEADPEPAH